MTSPPCALSFATASTELQVRDNDGLKLSVRLPVASVSESVGSVMGSVAIRNSSASAQTIYLSSSDPARASVISQVVVPSGATSAPFTLFVHDNALADGSHPVTITAARPGAVAGSATLSILDDDAAATLGAATTDLPRSKVTLSSAAASAADSTIPLRFSGPLDEAAARDASKYFVSVNGQTIEVEAIAYQTATNSVIMSLPEKTLQHGDEVQVRWNELSDARGALLSGSAKVIAR
jgi:hypothetical protein